VGLDEKDGGTVNKWLVIILIAFTWYVADVALDDHTAQISKLQAQVSELNTELTDLKTQQEAINFISQDLSAGLAEVKGWK